MKKSYLLEKLHFYLYAITFSFVFVGLFTLPKGHEVIEVLVILSLLAGALNYFINKQTLTNMSKLLTCTLLVSGLVILINHSIHGDWDRYGRAFLYMAAFVLLNPKIPNIKQIVFYSVAIGGVILGTLSLYQFNTGLIRVDGFTNAILFSQHLFILLIFNIYFFLSKNDKTKFFSLISICFLFVGLYLSQTRGVWLAILLLVCTYLFIKAYKKPLKYSLIALVLVFIAFSTYDNSGFVRDKVASGISDIEKAKDGHFSSSWGLRIIAWDSAVKDIKNNYLIGVGKENFYLNKKAQVEKGEVNPLALNSALHHTHNQYLQSQLIRGIPGTIALLLLLLYPWLSSGFITNKAYLFKSIAFSYAIFSLSDVPFEHLNTIYLYTLSMALLSYFSLEEKES